MQRCRFHVDEICTTCRFHEDKICTLAYFMRITTFYILFISPLHILLHLLPSKRPLPTHSTKASGLFIFPYFFNYCKPRSFYFSMLRLRLTLFPLLFNCCKPCSFFIFLRCICRPALSLIICLYKSSLSSAAAALQAIFLFFL